MTPLELEQLEALWIVTWDGDLISKSARSHLITLGLARRAPEGYTVLTDDGLRTVLVLKRERGERLP